MSRAIIVATIVLAFSSPSFAASDEELGKLGDKMSGAFKCSIYASMLDELKEQQRLFQIGLKAGRDFVDGMKSSNVPPLNELQTYMPGATTDFVVGQMFETESKKAYDEIPPEQRLDRSAEKAQAEIIYRESNCSLIQ